eukprot:scaffold42045_cov22-Tisochrysis_lutea.AAC.1
MHWSWWVELVENAGVTCMSSLVPSVLVSCPLCFTVLLKLGLYDWPKLLRRAYKSDIRAGLSGAWRATA